MGAFNGRGTFVRSYNWTNDAANGIDITASRVDTEDTGFASGLSLCVTRDGQGQMAADFLPAIDNTYFLGSVTFRWKGLNAGSIVSSTTQTQAWGPVAGALVDLTPDSSTYSATWATGFTTTPSASITWARVGKLIMLRVPAVTLTSNANVYTVTGAPASIRPTTGQTFKLVTATDNGTSVSDAEVTMSSAGTLVYSRLGSANGWTATGIKGINSNHLVAYFLD